MNMNAVVSEVSTAWDSAIGCAGELTDELKRQGKRLRAAIKHTYQKLKSENRLPFFDGSSEDVSPLVAKYVPIGMPLQDAETLLRHAKLKIAPQLFHWSHRNFEDRKSHMRAEAILERKIDGDAFISVLAYPENLGASETKVGKIVSLIGIQANLS